MRPLVAITVAAVVTAAGPAPAQHSQPYAGLERREIKALSDKQIEDLKAGRGMGLALAAELNGYPGPLHVLEMADQLGLSTEQRDAVRAVFETMKTEAAALGGQLIEQERHLDLLFASGAATPERLAAATREIGATQAELRYAHLRQHLAVAAILAPDQIQRYRELRGYAFQAPVHRHRHH